MRLLFVTNGFPPRGQWGTEYYTHQLVSGLRARDHEVVVLHPDRTGARPRYTLEQVDANGVPVVLLHNPGDPRKRFSDSYSNPAVDRLFAEVLDEVQPDVVHFVYLLWGLSARLPVIARERGVASVLTLTDYGLLCHRGQMFDWRLERCEGPHPPAVCARCVREPSRFDGDPLSVWAKRLSARALAAVGGAGLVVTTPDLEARERAVQEALAAAGHLIAPTAALGEAFRRAGVPAERLTELVYAIDEAPFEAIERRTAPPGLGQPRVFGFLGQFTPHKGLGVLLRAVELMERRLPESVEPWEVRLYGGPAGGRHRRFAESALGSYAGGRVRVCEPFPSPEAPRVLGELDCIVLPSLWDENAPLTVLQARAAGVPLIASDVAGVAEVVEDGVHGRLVRAGDPEALADAMREVVLGEGPAPTSVDVPMRLSTHVERIEELYSIVVAEAYAGATR